jgi:hypothetical protein
MCSITVTAVSFDEDGNWTSSGPIPHPPFKVDEKPKWVIPVYDEPSCREQCALEAGKDWFTREPMATAVCAMEAEKFQKANNSSASSTTITASSTVAMNYTSWWNSEELQGVFK